MDSNDLERERASRSWPRTRPSATRASRSTSSTRPATPTSAARSSARSTMVDGVLLLVDAAEGPLPQTRFVLEEGARGGPAADRRHQQDRPRATRGPPRCSTRSTTSSSTSAPTEDQLEFPVSTPSPATGTATARRSTTPGDDLEPLFETILATVPGAALRPGARRSQFRATTSTTTTTSAGSRSAASSTAASRPGRACRVVHARRLASSSQGHGALRLRGPEARRDRARRARATSSRIAGIDEHRRSATRSPIAERPQPLPPHPHRRADHRDGLRRQHVALRREGGQLRHLAPAPRAPRRGAPHATSASGSRRPTRPTRFKVSGAASSSSRS